MSHNIWRRWVSQLFRRAVTKRSRFRHRRRPLDMELLEDRVVPATDIWTGMGTGPTAIDWSNINNWNLNRAPIAGDDIVFNSTTAPIKATIDNVALVTGTSFDSLSFQAAGYSIGGTAKIPLNGGLTAGANLGGIGGVGTGPIISDGVEFIPPASNPQQTVTVGGGTVLDISGVITGSSSAQTVFKAGTGTLELDGSNTGYTGGWILSANGGIILLTNGTALGTGTVVSGEPNAGIATVDSNAQIQVQGGITVPENLILNGPGFSNDGAILNQSGTNTWTGFVQLDSNSYFGSNAGNLTFSNTISDAGSGFSAIKVGYGTITFAAADTYRGQTIVNNGILAIENPLSLGAGANSTDIQSGTIGSETIVNYNASANTFGTLEIEYNPATAPIAASNPNAILNSAGAVVGFQVFNDLLVLSGPGADPLAPFDAEAADNNQFPDVWIQGLTQNHLGALYNLSGTNGWDGNVSLGSTTSSTADPVTTYVFNNGGLGYTERNDVFVGAAASSNLSISGVVSNGSSAPLLDKVQPGRIILTSADTYTGGTEVDQGDLEITDSEALGTGGVVVGDDYVWERFNPDPSVQSDPQPVQPIGGSWPANAATLELGVDQGLDGTATRTHNRNLGFDSVTGSGWGLADNILQNVYVPGASTGSTTTFTLTFTFEGVTSTTTQAANVGAAKLQTALNGLTSITDAGGVTVTESGDTYIVYFNDSLTSLIPLMTVNSTIVNAEVTPATQSGINAVQEVYVPGSGSGTSTNMILTFTYEGITNSTTQAANVGATSLASALNSLTSIQEAGGVTVTESGDIYLVLFNSTTNNIPLLSINTTIAKSTVTPATDMQEIDIPGSASSSSSGNFTLTFNYNGQTSSTLPLAANVGATALANNLNALASIKTAGGVQVTQDGNIYRVYFISTTNNVPLMTLTTTIAGAAVNPVYGLIVSNPILISGTGLNNEGAISSLSGINNYIASIVIGNAMNTTAAISVPPAPKALVIDEAVFDQTIPAWIDITPPTPIPSGSMGVSLDSRTGHTTADNSYLTYDYKLTIPAPGQITGNEFYSFGKFGTGQLVIANSNTGIKGPTTIAAGWITVEANNALGPTTVDTTLSALLQPDSITVNNGGSLQLLPQPGQSITLGNNLVLSGLGIPATTPAVPGINFHMLTEGSVLSLGGDNLLTGTIQLDGTGSIGVDDPVLTDLANQSILTVTGEIEDFQTAGGGTISGGLDKLGERELIVQGPGTYTGSNVIVSGTLLLQSNTGLGLDSTGTSNTADTSDVYSDTTTAVETGGLLELGNNNPEFNGGLASSVQVWSENLALFGGGQQLNISGSGGTFELSLTDPNTNTSYLTGNINVASTTLASDIQAALNAVLPAGDSVMVIPTVFGTTGFVGLFTVLFEGVLANLANPLLKVIPGAAPGNATVTVSGSAYPVYALDDNYWSGGVTLNEPVLPPTSPPLTNFNSTIEVANNARLSIEGTISDSSISAASGSSLSVNTYNAIAGTSADTSADNGELVLAGSSTYRGNTYDNAGILTVASNQALGAPSMPEVQQIQVNETSGTFTLSFNGDTTATTLNAASPTLASDIQTALNNLLSIEGVGASVTVAKSVTQSSTYVVTFGGTLIGFQEPTISSSTPKTVVPTEVQAGYGGVVVAMNSQMELEGNLTIAGKSLEISGSGQSAGNTPSQIPFSWIQVGPAPIDNAQTSGNNASTGRVTGVAVDPSDPNVIYISTAGGGAWRTINDGLTWTPLFDGVPEIQTITVNTTGSFNLTFNGKTVLIPGIIAEPNVPLAAQIQSALNGLTTIGGVGGSAVVTQAGNVYTVTFGGNFTNNPESLITSTTAPALPAGSIVQIQLGAGSSVAIYSGAIAVDPENVATIYLGTGEADNSGDSYYGTGVYVTHNYGETWTLLTGEIFQPTDTGKSGNPLFGDAISSIIVDPNWENTIYVSTSDQPVNDPDADDGSAGAWRWSANPASPDIGSFAATWTDLTTIVSLLRNQGALDAAGNPTDVPAEGLLSIIAKLDTEPNVDPSGILPPTVYSSIALGVDFYGYGNPGETGYNPATPGVAINIAALPEPYAPGIYDPISESGFPAYGYQPRTPGPDDNWDVTFPTDGVYSSLAYGKADIPLLDLDFDDATGKPNNFQIDAASQNPVNNVPVLYVALGDPAGPGGGGYYDGVFRLLDPFDASADKGGISTVWDVGDGNPWSISDSSSGDPSTLTIKYDSGDITNSPTSAGAFPLPFPNTIFNPPQYGFDAAGDPLPDSGNIKVTASGYSVYASIAWAEGNLLLAGNPEFEYLFASQNGGNSWVDPDPGLSNYFNTQGDYDSFIIASPTDPQEVFVGGCVSYGEVTPGVYSDQVLMSGTGGTTFSDISVDSNGNGPHTDEHAAALDSNGNLIVANDGGVWEYDVGTGTWIDLNGNLSITTMNSVSTATGNPQDILAASQDNGTELSDPSETGATAPAWQLTLDGDGGDVAFDPQNSQIAYGMADGALVKSTNGGQSFPISLYTDNLLYFPYSVDQNNPNRLVVGGTYAEESDNQGASWSNLNAPATLGVTGLALAQYQGEDGKNGTYVPDPAFPDVTDQGANTYVPGTIYITGYYINPATGFVQQGLWVTKDDGLNWSADRSTNMHLPNTDTIQSIAVNPLNEDNVFAVIQTTPGGGNEVFESFDAGQTWTNITKASIGGNLPDVPFWTMTIDPRTDTLYLGTEVGVFSAQMQSQANAAKTTWTRFGLGMPDVEVTQIVLDMSTNTLTASTYGRSIYQFDLSFPTANSGALDVVTGTSVWTGPIQLMGAATFEADGIQNLPAAQAQLEIQGVISDGTFGADYTLSKTGLGTYIFSGANDYGGQTIVVGGALVANNLTALGVDSASPAAIVDNGAALELSANLDAVTVELIGNGLTFNEHYTGALDNISGDNSFQGNIELDPADNSSAASPDPTTTIGAISGTEMTLTGVISSVVAGPLIKEGTGIVVLDDSNTYNGTTYAYQGTLQADNSNAFAYSTEPGNAIDVVDGAQVQLQAPQDIQSIAVTATSGTFALNFGGDITGTLTVSSTTLASDIMNALNQLANIGGVGGIVSVVEETAGLFTVFFGGTLFGDNVSLLQVTNLAVTKGNVTTGLIQPGGPTVNIHNSLVLSGTGVNGTGALSDSGGSNTWSGPITFSTLAGFAPFTTPVGVVYIGANDLDTLTLLGAISDEATTGQPGGVLPISLLKVGAGVLVMPTTNAYTGTTEIQAGILDLQNPAALGNRAADYANLNTVQDIVTEDAVPTTASAASAAFTIGFAGHTKQLKWNTGTAAVVKAFDTAGTGLFAQAGIVGATVTVTKTKIETATQDDFPTAATPAQGLIYTVTFNGTAANTITPILIKGLDGIITDAGIVSAGNVDVVVDNNGGTSGELALDDSATGTPFTVAAPHTLTLNGDGPSSSASTESLVNATGDGALFNFIGDNTWGGKIDLATATQIGVASGTTLTLTGTTKAGSASPNDDISDSLEKVDPGTLIYSSTGSFVGYTIDTAGNLQVDGSVGTIDGVVLNGGTLSGTGTVGPISYLPQVGGASAGTIDPGDNLSPDPVGTLTSSGVLSPVPTPEDTLDSGTTGDQGVSLVADIGPSPNSDLLKTTDAGVNLGGMPVNGTVVGGPLLTGNVAASVSAGQSFALIETDYNTNHNDSVTGMFSGATVPVTKLNTLGITDSTGSGLTAYGATIDWIDNEKFIVSYYNDEIEATRELASVSMILTANGSSTGTPTSTIQYGQNEQIVAELIPEPNAPAVTGQVTFTVIGPSGTNTFSENITAGVVNGVAVGLATLNNLNSTTQPLEGGNYTITATYNGFNVQNVLTYNAIPVSPNPPPAVTVQVNKANTTIDLTSSDYSPVSGEFVTFTADVASVFPPTLSGTLPPGGATLPPSGSVTFYDSVSGSPVAISGTVNYSYQDSLVNGTLIATTLVATITTSSLPVGTHEITVDYNGTNDPNYNSVDSNTLTFVMNEDPTTTTVAASPVTTIFGAPVTFTATVTGDTNPPYIYANETPTSGTVTFSRIVGDTSIVFGTAPVGAGGIATLTTTNLNELPFAPAPNGEYVTATFNGDSTPDDFLTSSGNAQIFVNSDPTTTKLIASSASPSYYGEPVTFTAQVFSNPPGGGIPTGTVNFYQGTTTAGVDLVVNAANALEVTPDNYTVSGSDIGKTVDITSGSGWTQGLYQIENVLGGQWILNAAPAAKGAVGGQWTLFGTLLSSTTLNTSGIASTTTGAFALPVGSTNISALYIPSNNDYITSNSNSSSTNIVQQVLADPTTTAISSSAVGNQMVVGQTVTLTALVTSLLPGSGNPTGNVTFLDYEPSTGNTISLGTATLSVVNGMDEANLLSTFNGPQGTHEVYAEYTGDGNYGASQTQLPPSPIVSPPPPPYLVLALTQDGSAVSVTSSLPKGSVYGQPVTFTAQVTAAAPGSGTPTGQVTFFSNGTQISGIPVTLINGLASYTTTIGQLGTNQSGDIITATYSGDSNFTKQTGSFTQIVNVDSTTTTVASNGPSVYGNPATFTATVNANSPGGGNPLGTVNFYVTESGTLVLLNSTPVSLTPVAGNANSSTAVLSTAGTQLPVGVNQLITAVFTDTDGNFTGSSGTTSQTVSRGIVQVGVTSTWPGQPNNDVYGEGVTISATVTPALGIITPTGTVTFSIGTTLLAANVPLTLVGGVPTATIPSVILPEGIGQTISAVYNGDFNYTTGTGTLNQSVYQDPTTTTLTSLSNTLNVNQSVLIFATVTANSPGSGTPTGTVSFTDLASGKVLGGATLVNGIATLQTSFTTAGNHVIQAVYSGSTNYLPSTIPYPTIIEAVSAVGIRASKVSLTSSSNPAFLGSAVTFTATVKDTGVVGVRTPVGTVSFFNGLSLLGYGTLSTANGVTTATFTTSTLTLGSHSILAAYNGNATFAHSTSAALTQVVDPIPTRTSSVSLTSSGTLTGTNSYTSPYGQSITFKASVTDTGGSPVKSPTGSVTFTYTIPGSSTILTLGTVNLSGTGATTTASFTTSNLVVGTYNVTATYNGSTVFAAGPSSTITQAVTLARTTTTLTSSTGLNPSVYGQSVTFTAKVLLSSGSPAPGMVQFTNQAGTVLSTVNLSATGVATLTMAALPVGSDTIQAMYLGTTDSSASSQSLIQTVNQDTTKIAFTASTTVANQPLTLAATVTALAPGAGIPTGTVEFLIDNAAIYYGTLTNGQTSVTIPAGLPAGKHTIEAIYLGDIDFLSSTETVVITFTSGRGT